MKLQKDKCYYYFVRLMVVSSIVKSERCNIGNFKKTQIDFPWAKRKSSITFPVENGNFEE